MKQFFALIPPLLQFAGLLTAVAGLGTFYWVHVRRGARRGAVLDLATKRLAFWEQYLRIELTAEKDADRQVKARRVALEAVALVRAQADAEWQRMAWSQATDEAVRQTPWQTRLRWPSSLGVPEKFAWVCHMALAGLLLIAAGLFFFVGARLGLLFVRHARVGRVLLVDTAFFLTACYAVWIQIRFAVSLSQPARARAPVYDRV